MNNKRKRMDEFECTYCYRKYRKKDNYDKHISCCEFFYRSRREHPDTIYEPIPTQRELYQLVKELSYKCDKLQQKIEKLETTNRNMHRKQITEYLKEYVPEINAYAWAHQIEIQEPHLKTVFENTIVEGIKHVIRDHISIISLLPFCCFYQKNNVLYAYNNENDEDNENMKSHSESKWHVITNIELDKIISIVSYKFLKAFVEWKQTNESPIYEYEDEVYSNLSNSDQAIEEQIAEDLKKQQLMYMMKINGNRVIGNCIFSKIGEDVKRTEIKKLLCELTQKKLPTFVEG
jgi:hypothetical protein